MLRGTLGAIALAALALVAWAVAAYLRDMHAAYERVQAKGTVITSPYGDIEYTRRADTHAARHC